LSSLRPTARVARGATYLFVQGFSSSIIGLVYFIVLAHALSESEMGAFALLSFILALVQVFGTFAFPSAAVKYISQYLAEGNSEMAKAVVVRVLQTGLLAAAIAFLALYIPAEWVSSLVFGTSTYALLLRLIALCAIFTIVYLEVSSFLQGMQRMRDAALVGIVYSVVHVSLGVFLLFSGWQPLYAVALGWLAGLLISSVIGLITTAKHLSFMGKAHPLRPLVNFSFPLYVSGGIALFVNWVDQLLLAFFLGQSVLGVYYVAVRASAVPALFSTSVIIALFPQLSELYAQQGLNSLKDAFGVSTRYSVLIGFPLIVGLATLAYPIIILFGGWQYIGAAEPLIIISIGALVSTLVVAVTPILLTLERTIIASLLSVASVVLSFVLSYYALAYLGLGMIGTAWARTIAAIINLGISLYVLRRYVPVSFDKEALWKASAASAIMVLAILALDFARKLLSPDSYALLDIRLHLLPIYVVVGAAAYFLALIELRAIKKHDLDLVQEYLPQNLSRLAKWLERIAVAD
jgi:O-antigen/teichoic acid export membrane protein